MFFELYDNLLWFHSDVFKWSAKVKQKYVEELNLLQYLVGVPLVALVDIENTKLAKFAKLIGFQEQQPLLGQDKKMYNIYSRSL